MVTCIKCKVNIAVKGHLCSSCFEGIYSYKSKLGKNNEINAEHPKVKHHYKKNSFVTSKCSSNKKRNGNNETISISKEQYQKFRELWDNTEYSRYTKKVAAEHLKQCGINYDITQVKGDGTVFADTLLSNIRKIRLQSVHRNTGSSNQANKEYVNKEFAQAWDKSLETKTFKPLEKYFSDNPKQSNNRIFGCLNKGYSKFMVKVLKLLLHEVGLLTEAGNPITQKLEVRKQIGIYNFGSEPLTLKESISRLTATYNYNQKDSMLPLSCQFCGKIFRSRKAVERHTKDKHHRNIVITSKQSHDWTKSEVLSLKNKCELNGNEHQDLICRFCDIKFDSLYKYENHMKIHPICNHCGKPIYNEEILKKHMQGLL